ncbi:competence protein ComK [Bacillus sp. FJAT-27445]|uniref:competence protein ComK n=1 Tax=Bacillus sp. FJAT-27445 TaxID=1679166 RepID=UPI0007440AE3|nr:competence protein ComK [Bacillus sp. FJAT-27445]
MIILPQYMINEKTVGFWGMYGENGIKGSYVLEGLDQLNIGIPPLKIIDFTLKNLGFSLRGAIDGSKCQLGKDCKMLPLTINSQLGVFLLPTRAIGRNDCLWLSLMHIQSHKALSAATTRVFMNFGHTIDLEIKESLFIKKLDKARRLREIVTRNSQNPLTFYLEPKPGFTVVEGKGEYRLE